MRSRIHQIIKALLTPVAFILAIFAGAGTMTRPPSPVTATEVAKRLRGFLKGGSAKLDWTNFVSTPIENTELESIRMRAQAVGFPFDETGLQTLKELLTEAEELEKSG